MTIYYCPRCGYSTERKGNIRHHISRKTSCPSKFSEVNVEDFVDEILDGKILTFPKFECKKCSKEFKYKKAYENHIQLCDNNNSTEIIKKFENRIKELESKLEKTALTTINNTTNNNTLNYITVQLRPYNDPKLPDDMDDIYEDAWSKKKSLVTFIERLHMSPDLPENHNMCITNLKSKLAKVFTEQGWVTKDEDALLDEIIMHTTHLMDRWVRADPQRRIQYEEEYFDYLERIGHKRINDENKDDIRLLLYDSQKTGIVNIKSNTVKFTPPN